MTNNKLHISVRLTSFLRPMICVFCVFCLQCVFRLFSLDTVWFYLLLHKAVGVWALWAAKLKRLSLPTLLMLCRWRGSVLYTVSQKT